MPKPQLRARTEPTQRAWCETCEERIRPSAYARDAQQDVWERATRHALELGHEVHITLGARISVERTGVEPGRVIDISKAVLPEAPTCRSR